MNGILKDFLKNKQFVFFTILILLIVLTAVLAPVIAPYDPYEAVLKNARLAPSPEHLFGTDKLGRDLFSRVIYGARVSLPATLSLVGLVFFVGVLLGIISGFYGGMVDAVIMRLADMMVSFPGMVLAMAVAGIMGASIRNAVIAVSLVTWPKYARMARSIVLKVKNEDYMAAARIVGGRDLHIMIKYLFPIVAPTLVITAATDIGGMMLELASLSYLGFGAVSPMAEWGLMLSEGRPYMSACPWMMIYPGLAIFIVVVIFNFWGDALRDVLDPRQQ